MNARQGEIVYMPDGSPARDMVKFRTQFLAFSDTGCWRYVGGRWKVVELSNAYAVRPQDGDTELQPVRG